MPTKRPNLIKGETYHIILRGIEGRKIFLDEVDYLRFLNDLVEFNDRVVTLDNPRRFRRFKHNYKSGAWDDIPNIGRKKPIVKILATCLMPTHIHLLIKQSTERGISLFFQKLGGYSTYFNKKYHRFGSLFQRPFKAVHIKDQQQLETVVCYIHTNPVELIEPNWKEKGIKDIKKAERFIENFPWSSLGLFWGKKSIFSIIIDRKTVDELLEGPKFHRDWIRGKLFQKTKLSDILDDFRSQKIHLE